MIPAKTRLEMRKAVTAAMTDICQEVQYKEVEIRKIFQEKAFKEPKDPNFRAGLNLKSEDNARKVERVHLLYNEPDASVNKAQFQVLMKDAFDEILEILKETCPIVTAPEPVPVPAPAAPAASRPSSDAEIDDFIKMFEPMAQPTQPYQPAAAKPLSESPFDFVPPPRCTGCIAASPTYCRQTFRNGLKGRT